MQTIYFEFKCKIGLSNVLDVYIIDDQHIYNIGNQGNNTSLQLQEELFQAPNL